MFDKEFIASVMDTYQCNQLVVDRDGRVFALKPEGQFFVPGLVFDTDTSSGVALSAAISKAMGD